MVSFCQETNLARVLAGAIPILTWIPIFLATVFSAFQPPEVTTLMKPHTTQVGTSYHLRWDCMPREMTPYTTRWYLMPSKYREDSSIELTSTSDLNCFRVVTLVVKTDSRRQHTDAIKKVAAPLPTHLWC